MHVSFSLRRIAVVVALGLLILAGTVSAVQAAPFHASGTVSFTNQGNRTKGIQTGFARPGGPFNGAFSGKQTGYTVAVEMTWDFGGGDMLTFDVVIRDLDHDGQYVGTYVITGGTGRLADASGSGSFIFEGGEFALDGTLSH